MVLSLELGFGLHTVIIGGPDDSRPSVWQLPVDFGLAGLFLGVCILILGVFLHLIQAGNASLTLQATHPIYHDEGHQRQSQDDQPLSKFHGSSAFR